MYIATGQGQNIPWVQNFVEVERNSFLLCLIIAIFILMYDTNAFSPLKSIREQVLHCRRICQGQPSVIISINCVELESPMLHAKIKIIRFWFLRFLKIFSLFGHGGHLCHVT